MPCAAPAPAARGGYLSTAINEGTRFAAVEILQHKSGAEVAECNAISWFQWQTDLRVQRVRCARGREYMEGNVLRFNEKKGIQLEPGPGYSPEINGMAERLQTTLQGVALPSLADSGDKRHGLKPLSNLYQACEAADREGISLGKALEEMVLLSFYFPLSGLVVIRCD
jgi:hypothetical protein